MLFLKIISQHTTYNSNSHIFRWQQENSPISLHSTWVFEITHINLSIYQALTNWFWATFQRSAVIFTFSHIIFILTFSSTDDVCPKNIHSFKKQIYLWRWHVSNKYIFTLRVYNNNLNFYLCTFNYWIFMISLKSW